MKALIQRVTRASVTVDEKIIGEIDQGIVALIGFGADDNESKLAPMAEKIAYLRIFTNEKGRFDKSLLDINGALLLVPQFTLYGKTDKGRRPDFFAALAPEKATALFDSFVEHCRNHSIASVQTGEFGAYMKVDLQNDGPVTLMLEN